MSSCCILPLFYSFGRLLLSVCTVMVIFGSGPGTAGGGGGGGGGGGVN